ncbi:unnamed protein product [Lathyrus sativus]|nr:unnamed protein product [Lathyrus sativus]
MKIINWNCRGLGNPRAVRALIRLTHIEKRGGDNFICLGDMNNITSDSEKRGGASRSTIQFAWGTKL